uniref:Band 7 domain-containing protein n=1 Tax=Arcella intermedia TaxID=1963864 RepID=A0A6B2LBB5_9EUKA
MVWSFLALLVVGVLVVKVIIVNDGTVVIIERLGRYHRTLPPGLHFLIRFLHNERTVQWSATEFKNGSKYFHLFRSSVIPTAPETFDIPPIQVFTKDLMQVSVDLVVRYQIKDVKKAAYNTKDLFQILQNAIETSLMNAAACVTVAEILYSKDSLQGQMMKGVDLSEYGVEMKWMGVQRIDISPDYQKVTEGNMLKQKEAETILLIQQAKRLADLEALKNEQEIEMQRVAHKIKMEEMNMKAQMEREKMLLEMECARVKEVLKAGVDLRYLNTYTWSRSMVESAKAGAKVVMLPNSAFSIVDSN